MAYRLTYAGDAEKGLAGMPKVDARRILAKLEQLAEDPQAMPGVEKLTDREGYRIRSGDWCAIYLLDHASRVVTVVGVFNRREAYR